MGVRICTIAARNYLPFTRVLATSAVQADPDARVSALIFDDLDASVGAGEPFEVIRLGDLGEDPAELRRMAAIYDVTELATALKPWLLEVLLDADDEPVLYLDPDIQVFASLAPLAQAAADHGIVLTPHIDVPLPLDDLMTDDRAILASGTYNLGFIGVGKSARPFLSFWKERLSRQCVNDPEHMRFVDQRWVDFVPGLFDHVIVREPQYNVAYWNLHGREVAWSGERWEVNGAPLAFFHFSGYSPKARHLLSKHQGDRPRILLSEHRDLAQLCDRYGDLLVAHGYGTDDTTPYGFDAMADGTPMDDVVRGVFREWLAEAEAGSGAPMPPDPFHPDQVASVMDRLTRPPVSGPDGRRVASPLSAYLAALYARRPALRAAMPDPNGADRGRFLDWAVSEARAGRIAEAFVTVRPAPAVPGGRTPPPVTSTAGSWAAPERLRAGIVVAGFLNAELGIGESARLMVSAVEASGLPFTTVGFERTNSRQQHPFDVVGTDARDFDTNIVVVNPDFIGQFAAEAGSEFFAGRTTVAYWAWELEEFPASFLPALEMAHEIWAISEFTRAAIAKVTDKPVLAMPLPVVPPQVDERVDRPALGLPDGFLFLFCFDLFSALERKNPLGLIDAFCRAFAPGEGPTLVVKAVNGDRCVADLERLRRAIGDRPDILLIDRYLSSQENAALMAMADCYVSLHRSEGFGLTMAEAMSLGKPVIATAYSANLEFMDETTAYLVRAGMTEVPEGADPYPAGARWGDPDLDEAARLMRVVVDDPAAAAEVGRRAQQAVVTDHSVDRLADLVRHRFDEIQQERADRVARAASSTDAGSPGTGPVPTTPGDGAGGRRGGGGTLASLAGRAARALRAGR